MDDNSGDETVNGLGGLDTIYGGIGDDTLNGDAGDDFLIGEDGNDTLNGGADNDAIVDSGGTTVDIDAGSGDDLVVLEGFSLESGALEGGTGSDVLRLDDFFNLQGFALSGFEVLGTSEIYTITGTAAQFDLFDKFTTDSFFPGTQISLAIASIGAAQSADLSDELGLLDLNLTGSIDNETISAGAGDDALEGGSGSDTLNGGAGFDVLRGGIGNDTLNGGGDSDTASYTDATSGVTISLAIAGPQAVGGTRGSDTLIDIENLIGSNHNDTLTGNAADNILSGGTGDDTLNGGGGDDVAAYADASGGVTVDLGVAGPQAVGANQGTDTLIGIEGVIGSTFGDSLTGTSGDNFIDAGAGGDIVQSGGGNDTIIDVFSGDTTQIDGGAGDDTIILRGFAGVGPVDGGTGTDILAAYSIFGVEISSLALTGLEILETRDGAVFGTADQFESFDIIRRDANDPRGSVSLALATAGLPQTLDLSDELTNGGGPRGADIIGTIDGDTIITGDGADQINGAGGDDVLEGRGGDDQITDLEGTSTSIDAGAGDDTVRIGGSIGSGILSGGTGIDTLRGTSLSLFTISGFEILESLFGQIDITATGAQLESFDIIRVEASNPTATVKVTLAAAGTSQVANLAGELNGGGGPRAVVLTGSTIRDIVTAGDGNDTLSGGQGNDTLNGGKGDDLLEGGDGRDFLFGNDGDDTLNDLFGLNGTMDGGAGDDVVTISGVSPSSSAIGGVGQDILKVDTGDDLKNASISGFEVLELDGLGMTATALQLEAFDIIRAGAGSPFGVISFKLSDIGASQSLDLSDELNVGGPRDATVNASRNGDSIATGDGNDFLFGWLGGDTLSGSRGDDGISGRDGNDAINGGEGDDSLDGGSGDDTINGNDGNDRIFDITGAIATIDAGAGDDIVVLGNILAGNLLGGAGTDTLAATYDLTGLSLSGFEILEATSVIATAAQFESFDAIRKAATDVGAEVFLRLAATGAGQNLDIASELAAGGGPRAAFVNGSTDREKIVTGAKNDTIFGDGGNDALLSGLGSDTLHGGDDSDRLDGGDGKDVMNGDAGNDVIVGGLGDDRAYGGDGNDRIGGGDGNDVLIAGAGADRVDGGAGDDRIFGGDNSDVLIGGTGFDTFSFSNRFEGNDRIDDWVAADDQIGVDASAFGGGLVAGGLAANRLVVSVAPAANQAFGQFLFNSVTGQLSWDADGTGAGAAVARLLNGGVAVTTLTAGDFDVVA